MEPSSEEKILYDNDLQYTDTKMEQKFSIKKNNLA
jgi:Fe-S cluster assembly iron-binding protein IscA